MKNNKVQVNNNEQVEVETVTVGVGDALKRTFDRVVKPLLIYGGGIGLAFFGVKTIGGLVMDKQSNNCNEPFDDVVADQPFVTVEEPTEDSKETNE
jgi:hypothetical protein